MSSEPVWEELTKYPWSDWPEAGLVDVVRYLRGNVNLRLPKEWEGVLPKQNLAPLSFCERLGMSTI